jgi:putative tryptophan/tyrosine transport system substrate-binding protein
VAGLGLPALAWTGGHPNPPVAIGWLNTFNDRSLDAFKEGMAALGWHVGTQYVFKARYADGQADRLPALAQVLAATKPAVIVAAPGTSARLAAAAAPTTPIVLANGVPLSTGAVTSLGRPGGMNTGLSNVTGDLNPKMVELL